MDWLSYVHCPNCGERVEMPWEGEMPGPTSAEGIRIYAEMVRPYIDRVMADCQYAATMRHNGR